MKKVKYIMTLALLATATLAQAAEPAFTTQELEEHYNSMGTVPLALIVILALFIVLILLQVTELTLQLKKSEKAKEAAMAAEGVVVQKRATWWHLFSRSGPKDATMQGHIYDGIQEYDNNPPAWFNWLFYGTIVWGLGYMVYYHVLDLGVLPQEAYAMQMEEGEKLMEKAQEKAIRFADMPPLDDEASLIVGKSVYVNNCAMCHGAEGQGGIGPNLTDKYWKNGGKYSDVFKTIFNGVPEKGMLSWKSKLKPDELRAVASYVMTLRGTNPPDPKAPEGEPYEGE